MSRNVKNWKLPVYEMNEVESSNPAGNSFQELKEMELEDYTGAGTANTHCNCYSEDASYLCVTLHDNWSEHRILDEHHIFGGPNRKNSEEYGLKVYLCHDHHIYGPEAVHNNARIRHELQRTAQKLFEKQHSHKEFMEIFGRNYLDPVEIGKINARKKKTVQDSRPERETGL